MRTIMGVVIAAAGVVLVVLGLDANDSIGSRLSRLFEGTPTDKTIWLLVGGVLAVITGLAIAFTPPRRGLRT
jgi:hypothetical protein